MKTRQIFTRLMMSAIIFAALMLFLVVTPILVTAESAPLDQVSTGTATSYAYLPVVFNTAIETGVATLKEHSDTIVNVSVYSFLGFGLMVGVVGLLFPSSKKEAWNPESENPKLPE